MNDLFDMKKNDKIYISHLLPDDVMKEVLERTGAGIESIEFSISENLDHLSSSIRAYSRKMRKMGVVNLIIHGPFLDLNPVTFDSEIRRVTRLRFEQAYTAARELGAKKIVYHTCFHPDIYYLIGWADRMADFFNKFLENRKDIPVVLENVYDREWGPLLGVKEKMTNDNFSLCLDIGHANCYSTIPVVEWTEKLLPAVGHVHLHDNHGERDEHLALGRGNIDVRKVIEQIKNVQNCTCTLECSRKQDVIESFELLKSL